MCSAFADSLLIYFFFCLSLKEPPETANVSTGTVKGVNKEEKVGRKGGGDFGVLGVLGEEDFLR